MFQARRARLGRRERRSERSWQTSMAGAATLLALVQCTGDVTLTPLRPESIGGAGSAPDANPMGGTPASASGAAGFAPAGSTGVAGAFGDGQVGVPCGDTRCGLNETCCAGECRSGSVTLHSSPCSRGESALGCDGSEDCDGARCCVTEDSLVQGTLLCESTCPDHMAPLCRNHAECSEHEICTSEAVVGGVLSYCHAIPCGSGQVCPKEFTCRELELAFGPGNYCVP